MSESYPEGATQVTPRPTPSAPITVGDLRALIEALPDKARIYVRDRGAGWYYAAESAGSTVYSSGYGYLELDI